MNHFVVNNIVIYNLFSSTYGQERHSIALNGGFEAGLTVSRSVGQWHKLSTMSSRAEGQNIYISTLCIQYTYTSVTCILSVDSVDISTH
jgi:hypothetical protein